MSDTKWRKLVSALKTVPSVDHYFLKTIRGAAEEAGFGFLGLWAPHASIDTFSFGPLYLREIEWIEFPSHVQQRANGATPPGGHCQDLDGLRRALDAIGKLPLEETQRVCGWSDINVLLDGSEPMCEPGHTSAQEPQ
jgi:hypothetical protein